MKIGIPTWGGVVSPVLDAAAELLVVELGELGEVGRRTEPLAAGFVHRRAARVADLGIDLVICGALSRSFAEQLAELGVRVVPWISGRVEEVLQAFVRGELTERRFQMPGCCGRGGRRLRRGGGGRRL